MQATFPVSCHSVGLPVLLAVQFLERMVGYMLAVSLALFLDEHLHLGEGSAARIAGYFFALSYAAAVPGGIITDRFLGASRSIRVAVLCLALGYALTARGAVGSMLGGAALLIIGSGLFRPSVATISGAVGTDRGGNAFRWLYFVVNVAAIVAPIAAGTLRTRYGFSVIPAMAAMLLALAWLLLWRCRGEIHIRVEARPLTRTVLTSDRAHGLRTLAAFLSVFVLLGIALHQTAGTLLFWVRDDTQRTLLGFTIPPEAFAMLPGALALLYIPLLTVLSRRKSALPPHLILMSGVLLPISAYAIMIVAAVLRDGSTLASPLWLTVCLALLTLSEALIWPLGMRLINTLVPAHRIAQAHGLFCLATAIGYWLAGEVGTLWSRWPHAWFFALLAAVCVGALAILS
jgi:POT family proton-dependent oligopeptide transporter